MELGSLDIAIAAAFFAAVIGLSLWQGAGAAIARTTSLPAARCRGG